MTSRDDAMARRIAEAEHDLTENAAFRARFNAKMHPHDRNGRWRETFKANPEFAKKLPLAGSPGKTPEVDAQIEKLARSPRAKLTSEQELHVEALKAMEPGEHRIVGGAYVHKQENGDFTVHHPYGSPRFKAGGYEGASDKNLAMSDANPTVVLDSMAGAAEAEQGAPKMMVTPMMQATQMESSLKPGHKVAVRWTGNYEHHGANGTVSKVNKSSVKVKLEDGSGYEITVPRQNLLGLNSKWSVNNRVEPRTPLVDRVTEKRRQALGGAAQKTPPPAPVSSSVGISDTPSANLMSELQAKLEANAPKAQAKHAPQFGDTRPDLIGSPGRSGAGRLRNFKAMSDGKLAGVLGQLTAYGEDPEALAAAQAEAAKRTGKQITEALAVSEAKFSSKQRDELASKGDALPDGSFPIRNARDLGNAIQALGRAKDRDAAKAHIVARAKALGLVARLPDDWKVQEALMTTDEQLERRVEQRMIAEAADSLAKASTPEPFSTSKTSNWVARGGGLPAYIQHIAHALVRKRGMDESKAIEMAIGIVKRWARGGGNVDAGTKAAATKALGEWESLKARNVAKKAA